MKYKTVCYAVIDGVTHEIFKSDDIHVGVIPIEGWYLWLIPYPNIDKIIVREELE